MLWVLTYCFAVYPTWILLNIQIRKETFILKFIVKRKGDYSRRIRVLQGEELLL